MSTPLNIALTNHLKTTFLKIFLACALFSLASISVAAELYELHVQNPNKQIGYVVGDVFTRTVELNVKAPYKLSAASIPTKGLQQKGIELRAAKVTEKETSKSTRYQLQLKYQIFTSGPTVRKLAIAKHPLIITHAGKSFKINIPQWKFRVSPLAVNGEVYIEQDMSPYRGPMLVDAIHTQYWLGAFLFLILLSTFGLIYINADLTWFPGMGGPFAMSYRKISSLAEARNAEIGSTEDSALIQQATTSIHHAFNQTFGENVFATDIDLFVQKHPAFANIKQEISQFFKVSNHVLFAVNASDKTHISIAALMQFCAQCRHCERNVA
jgi:mxaA protein